jgi:peroxiredoxin
MKPFLTLLLLLVTCTCLAQNGMYDICPIKNSQEIPSAQVYDTDGKAIDLKSYVGKKKAVVVFYRGGWCGYCMKHLSALQEVKVDIDELGYELIAITPDDFLKLESSREAVEGLDYTLLSDKEANAMKAFGIAWQVTDDKFEKYKEKYSIDLEWWSASDHHLLPVPAVFIIENGKVQYQHVDPEYSERLSPEILLSFLGKK